MRFLLLVGISLISFNAYAICPAAPVGTASDPVLQLRLNADSKAGLGAANFLTSTEEGALVWDDAANAIAYCDGTNWITLGAIGGSDDLGNHTATQTLAMGANDITGTGTYTAGTLASTAATGLLWENGVNSLTYNDGGGNVQMRMGHDFTTGDERFTHGGGAVVMTSNIDAVANTALTFKVSSNPGAGNDQPVTWGSSLVVTPSDVTFGGTSLLPIAETDPQVGTLTNTNFCTTDGTAVNCTTAPSALDAATVDGIDSASFIRADANDTVAGHTEWQDNMDVRLGTDADFRMDFNGADTVMRSYTHGARVIVQGEDAAGTNRNLFIADPDNNVALYYAGAKKFETANTGVTVAGRISGLTDPTGNQDAATKAYVDTAAANADTVDSLHAASFIRADANDNITGHTEWQDSYEVRLGNNADFRIRHDGTNHVIRGYTHGVPIYITAEDGGGTDRTMILADPDNNTRLYYNGTEKFRTTSDGVRVVGVIKNLTDPTSNQHAATKKYVDDRTGGGGISSWVNFNGQGTVSVRGSHNVSSVTDLGVGYYRVNFSTAMSNTDYAIFIYHGNALTAADERSNPYLHAKTTTGVTIYTTNVHGHTGDWDDISVRTRGGT